MPTKARTETGRKRGKSGKAGRRAAARAGAVGRKAKKKKTARRAAPGREESRLKTVLEHIGPDFIEESARKIRPEDVAQAVREADRIRRRFERGQALGRFRRDGELLLGLVEDHAAGRYRAASYWTLSVAAFALRYVLKPIDIIPDTLPVIGQLDDAMVVSHALAMIRAELRAYKIWRLADASGS